MAKTATARKSSSVQRQTRRVPRALRQRERRVKPRQARPARTRRPQQLTLGELIAAAFDTVGGELGEVLALMSSPQFAKAVGRHIILEP